MMEFLAALALSAIQVLATLAILVTGVSYVLRLKQGLAFARRLGWVAAGAFLFLVLLPPVVSGLEHSINLSFALLLWLPASVIAYFIREQGKGKTNSDLRGAERTPMVPQHLDGERQR
jgi:hypothetical protein